MFICTFSQIFPELQTVFDGNLKEVIIRDTRVTDSCLEFIRLQLTDFSLQLLTGTQLKLEKTFHHHCFTAGLLLISELKQEMKLNLHLSASCLCFRGRNTTGEKQTRGAVESFCLHF